MKKFRVISTCMEVEEIDVYAKTKKEAEQEASRIGLLYFDSSFEEDSDSELEL